MTPLGRSRAAGEDEQTAERTSSGGLDGGPEMSSRPGGQR